MKEQDPVIQCLSKVNDQWTEFLQRIGSFSVTFAAIEQSVVHSVCLCLGGHDWSSGFVVTDKLQYSATLALLDNLFRKKLPAQYLERMEALIPDLLSAGKIRNETLHATAILVLSEHGEFMLEDIRHRMNKKNSQRNMTLDDLDRHIAELRITSNNIDQLNRKMLRYFTKEDAGDA